MLHDFVTNHRQAIIARAREKLTNRPWPLASTSELENGVPLFLTQLSDVLRCETQKLTLAETAMSASATLHGAELLALGFDVSQVVHDYGDICQAVTELALEQRIPITIEEFHTLNRCLDMAIAEAVTEHGRILAQSRSTDETERLGQLAHEIRDTLNTALLAFHSLKRGAVGVTGNTAAVLGRSLLDLRDLVDSTLSDVRITANNQRRERVSILTFLNEIGIASGLHAEYRGLRFSIEPHDPELAVTADPQLLASAVMNLLNNAFKFTPVGGRVVLRSRRAGDRIVMEVEDECGGIPESHGNPFEPFRERRGHDRTGMGLGLSIALKAVKAHDGNISIRNLPGKGCVFVIEVPVAAEEVSASAAFV